MVHIRQKFKNHLQNFRPRLGSTENDQKSLFLPDVQMPPSFIFRCTTHFLDAHHHKSEVHLGELLQWNIGRNCREAISRCCRKIGNVIFNIPVKFFEVYTSSTMYVDISHPVIRFDAFWVKLLGFHSSLPLHRSPSNSHSSVQPFLFLTPHLLNSFNYFFSIIHLNNRITSKM